MRNEWKKNNDKNYVKKNIEKKKKWCKKKKNNNKKNYRKSLKIFCIVHNPIFRESQKIIHAGL